MLNCLMKFIEKRKLEQKLLRLYREVALNWENWHVMHQRNVLDRFALDAWLLFKSDPQFNSYAHAPLYVQKLTQYNQGMDDFRSYEEWYSSDIKNKVNENARQLHAKREAAFAIFKDLLAVIEPFKKEVETQLYREGIVQGEQKVG